MQLRSIQPNIRWDAGPDRYATSRVVTQRGFDYAANGLEPSGIAFLATGTGYADTLPSPVLLVSPDRVDPAVADEIERLHPDRVVVLGGSGVVSDATAYRLVELASAVATGS